MIEAYTLFSGSGGNCIYVKNENTKILIDAGKSCGAIEKALSSLGTSLCEINEIFITHEHSDHIKGLEVISKKHKIPINITSPSYDEGVSHTPFARDCSLVHEVEYERQVGTLHISSFKIPHDAKQNVGYKIISDDGDSLGIATDIGHLITPIANNLSVCRHVILESNHDIEMLKDGPYPYFLKERILSPVGHLSNEMCAKFVAYLAAAGVKEITLAHLSRENNLPKLAFTESRKMLDDCGFEDTVLKIADQDCAVCATDGRCTCTFSATEDI